MTQTSLSPRAWIELALLGFLWGASFLFIRLALNEYGPFWVVALRTSLAALFLWVLAVLRRWPLPSLSDWGALAVMGVLNNVIPFTLMTWGQQHIETGLTSILNAATAVWGVLLAALVFSDERLTPRKAVGVLLGFVGVATATGLGNLARLEPTSVAQLAVIAGTLSYAFASIWARRTLGKLKPQVAAMGMLSASSLCAIVAALALEGVPHWPSLPITWAAIAYMALPATALAYLLYYRVLATAGSGNLMLVTLLIPPVAIILGAVVLGESLSPEAYAGFALLALGLTILDGRVIERTRSASRATK